MSLLIFFFFFFFFVFLFIYMKRETHGVKIEGTTMAYVAVDLDGTEMIFTGVPYKGQKKWK